MAVDRQRQLAQPRARLLQRAFGVVERAAARLHVRLFRLQGQRHGLLPARLLGHPRGEPTRLLLELQEPPAEQDALHGDHLVAQDAVPARLARLPLETLELLFHLVHDVIHAQQVLLGRLELERGLPPAGPVLGDPGRLLDEGPAVGGLAGEDQADLALLDDGVRLGAEAGVHEQLVDVPQAADLAVHEVLALPVAVEPPGDDALGDAVRAAAVQARDLEVDLGHRQRLA